jgi:hypothetical protein
LAADSSMPNRLQQNTLELLTAIEKARDRKDRRSDHPRELVLALAQTAAVRWASASRSASFAWRCSPSNGWATMLLAEIVDARVRPSVERF